MSASHTQPAAAPGRAASHGLFRIELCYASLALVAPSGTVVTLYSTGERVRAEDDVRRLNAGREPA